MASKPWGGRFGEDLVNCGVRSQDAVGCIQPQRFRKINLEPLGRLRCPMDHADGRRRRLNPRADAGFPNLAVVVNRQSPPGGIGQIRRVQDRMIKEHPHCFAGADYDTLAKDETTDRVHLSESGEVKAAQLWANALNADFFRDAAPMQPK